VDAGLAGTSQTATVAATTQHSKEAGGILMTLGGMLLAGGATAGLRRHGRHTR
jgi:hypothetical protein